MSLLIYYCGINKTFRGYMTISRSSSRIRDSREHYFETKKKNKFNCSWWVLLYNAISCCLPSFFLKYCCRMTDRRVQSAWREKFALCVLIAILCLALAFLTYGFTTFICIPPKKAIYRFKTISDNIDEDNRWFLIHGQIYNIPEFYKPYKHKHNFDPYNIYAGQDLTAYFPWAPSCEALGIRKKLACKTPNSKISYCHNPSILNHLDFVADVAYDWSDIEKNDSSKIVYNGEVLEFSYYLDQVGPDDIKPFGEGVDKIIRQVIGQDGTKLLSQLNPLLVDCLFDNFRAGFLEVKSIGCIATDIILYLSLVVILAVVLTKFILAISFAFIMSKRLGNVNSSNISNNDRSNSITQVFKTSKFANAQKRSFSNGNNSRIETNFLNLDSTNSTSHMHVILLVTCYSESEIGLKTTLDSLAETNYPNDQKLLFIIADGIVTGSGNIKSTPDILIEMIELNNDLFEGFHFDQQGNPIAYSYLALATGTKRNNMARVYAGHYKSKNHIVPVILVIKCGTASEIDAPKPGNRGKRDSQIILMSFLSKVLLDDRMTPLEYDLFHKIQRLTNVFPDHYELVLMVDADTKVHPESLDKMVRVMRSDRLVMGLCGETRIANKTASWVTMIQVFEYYISHHLNKAFESIFGGVTCLPGCFCMYRIKAPKGDDGLWVPILASQTIIDQYSENITDTLHKKNLLLLGEDRYLTTLMLKTFPKRKLLFVPQALCKTMVPDEFSVLLSQRRRWINSTIHNLFELVLVPNLCGAFCCSMQFVIFMELIGTLVLPAAICFTFILIISSFILQPEYIPLALLGAILGLPALLILFTTRNFTYVFWFLVYIISLPIWNFLLPIYAFWHFDNFSWGETRKLASGVGKDDHHGITEGDFDYNLIFMKHWTDFEKERILRVERWRAENI